MDIFEHIVGVAALILGLGVTRLLESVLNAFRRREEAALHWLPLVWAGLVFAWQMQFLWATFELSGIITGWTVGMFSMVIVSTLVLFAAGSLLLPGVLEAKRPLLSSFESDGKWGLLCLSLYFLVSFLLNPLFFGSPLFGPLNLLLLPLAALPAAYIRFGSTSAGSALTVAFVALSIFAIIIYSPPFYQ